jgi:hypothetical protein
VPLGRADGAAAFAWLDEHMELWKHVLPDAASAWAVADPPACAEWMERVWSKLEMPTTYDPTRITGSPIWRTLLQHDLRAAIRVAGNLSIESPVGIPLGRNDLRPAIRTAADATAIGAEILAHPEWHANCSTETPLYLLVALRECWQEIDPDGWDRWAAAHPETAAKSAPQPLHPGIRFLRSTDRAVTAADILQATPPEKLEQTTTGLMRLWVQEDMAAAGDWLNAQPDSPAKTAAATAYALEAVKEDPAAALGWADTLADPAARARTQRRVFTAWYDAHPDAAAAWLPQSGWSDARQQAARDIMAVRR